jgi:Zn-dependent M28 family amino/carboxypeptidase
MIAFLIGILGVAAILAIFPRISNAPTSNAGVLRSDDPAFSGERALYHVSQLVAMGPRPTGSEAVKRAGDYIADMLKAYRFRVTEQPFTVETGEGTVTGRNVIAEWGEGESVIMLGTPYNTRLRADRNSEPIPGANNSGSGAGVLLEIARALDCCYYAKDVRVRLAFFDAENNADLEGWEGPTGSSYMARNLEASPLFFVAVDMVGDADQQMYYDRSSDPALSRKIWEIAAGLGYGDYFITQFKYSLSGVHVPFAEQGIAAVSMMDFDYDYWRTTQDTMDKLSADSLERAGSTLLAFLKAEGRISLR